MDARDREALDVLFGGIGSFDHLIIAASGGVGAALFGELRQENLPRGFDAKFWVHFNVAQSALPFMASDGSIAFVTGATSRFARPGTVGLAAVNGAIGQLVPTLARELAPLRVNAVSPGVIDTPWWSDKPSDLFEQEVRRVPLGRAGRPEEVADALLFLSRNRCNQHSLRPLGRAYGCAKASTDWRFELGM